MGKRGRPSLKKTNYSNLNYKKIQPYEMVKLLIDLLSKASRGLSVTEISKKFLTSLPEIRNMLNDLRNKGIVYKYVDIYFHKKYIKKYEVIQNED